MNINLGRDEYRDQIVTRLHCVMWVCFCIPIHIHCSYYAYQSCFLYNLYMSLFNHLLLFPTHFLLTGTSSQLHVNYMYMILHCNLTFMVISVAHSINILSVIGTFLLLWPHELFTNEIYMMVDYFLLAGN